MEEAQKTMNEQKQLKRLHYKHGKLQLKLKTIQLTGKKRTKSSFCRKREVYRRYFIPAYNAYIKGDEFNDFTSYETYKQKTIKALNTKIEDLKTQLAEETELLKEFQAAETDQEKEELIKEQETITQLSKLSNSKEKSPHSRKRLLNIKLM